VAYGAGDAAIAARLPPGVPLLQVYNKADLPGLPDPLPVPAGGLALSARSGQGLEALRRALLAQAGWQANPEGLFIARTRHVQALRRCQAHLQAALAHAAQRDAALDLLAEELRLAHGALCEITGDFSTEDLLGEIFGRFCIGK
jgi:tRNA modification GTPase